MKITTLIFDLKVLGPIDISYQEAIGLLTKDFHSLVNPASRDIFTQLTVLKRKIGAKKFGSLRDQITNLLDKAEIQQMENFPLYPGVKNGLASLKPMKLTVLVSSEFGKPATDIFLEKNEINQYIDDLISRKTPEDALDMGLRLRPLLNEKNLKTEECIYFCNKLGDLISSRSLGLKTIVLPSKNERLDNILREKPDGMIMTLEELPNMLSLNMFKVNPEKADDASSTKQIQR